IAFTPSVREIQALQGSRAAYAGMDEGEDYNYRLGEREASFIAERDSIYMASVSETGWPYVQHRGGPVGFMKVLEDRRIGFADYSGNRQYVSVGNFSQDNRVALFFMDYPNRRRLKLLGRVRTVGLEESEILTRLEDENYPAQVERGFVIDVAGFDWNCPQHITPRYSDTEVTDMLQALLQENRRLRHVL
ncbi:MAG: pyridoxamine 5'-phosphate oxidase family protein, partial [Haliea sp.]